MRAWRICKIDAEALFLRAQLLQVKAAEQKNGGGCLEFCGNAVNLVKYG